MSGMLEREAATAKTSQAEFEPLSEKVGAAIRQRDYGSLDAVPEEFVKEALRRYGAVFFEGFGADVPTFKQFTDRFSNDYMDNTGSGSFRETSEKGDGTIQNVAYVYGVKKQRTFGLPLHADRSYVKTQPELVWFLCVTPANQDGETTVCDGVRVYQALSDHARTVFENNKLKYIRHYPADQWAVLFHTDDMDEVRAYCKANDLTLHENEDGSLTTEYVKSAIQPTRFGGPKSFVNSILIQHWQETGLGRDTSLVRLESGEKIPDEVVDEVKQVCGDLTVALPWSSGDFVVVDNTRLMHGRRPFQDPDREVYVRMCRSVDW